MYRATITPKSDKAREVVDKYGDNVQVLRTEDNGQTLFIQTMNNKGERWYGAMSSNEVEVQKLPNPPMSKQDQRVYELWKLQMLQEEKMKQKMRRLNHQKMMAKHKKKKKRK
jgi:hypothetical protein